ncbi:LPS export ABC transporter permease LptG [Roseateles sp.]|uniref:LPS export ABC transporter permease LptG n=1 Tax=Roseateles sp. TaxID=1971397 RepID=UPI003D107A75
MKTVRRLLYRDIVGAVAFVTLAFLSLFFFTDCVDEIDRMSRAGAGSWVAVQLALLSIPGHFYQLFPITVLIGTIFSLARLAQSSEFTILRTGGLGPGRALGLLANLALVFAVLTFVAGDYAEPFFKRQYDLLRASATGNTQSGAKGAWLKEHRTVDGQDRSYSINVGQADVAGQLRDVRIFEFDEHGGLISRTAAERASVDKQGLWQLQDVQRTEWATRSSSGNKEEAPVRELRLPSLDWPSSLHAGVITAAVLPAGSMSTLELYRYTEHLSAQEQSAQAHNIQFWRKALYPFACFVMIALALPFAYLHGRSGGISLKVFGGIMLGISFVLLNNVAGHMGILNNWTPWAAAASPSLVYLALSLAAFGWLVRYR